jgi:hypothetical protein
MGERQPAEAKPQRLPLSMISRQLTNQARGKTDPKVVQHYMRAMRGGEVFPPLGVANLSGALLLFDGFHRAEAMALLGIDEVLALTTVCDSIEEVRWLGFHANLRHAQPLKKKRHREAFRAYINAGRNVRGGGLQSYRDLAAAIPGTSYSAVRRWTQADFPQLFVEMGGGRTTAPGGLPDGPTQEDHFMSAALDHLNEAEALMAGVACLSRRGVVVERLREVSLQLDPEGLSFKLDLSAFGPE